MKQIILGLIGQVAAGKGTITDYLKKNYQAVSFRFSDPLRETLDCYDLEISRDNMQKISTLLRSNFGENILAKAMAKRVKNSNQEMIIIDGVRRQTDLDHLRDLPGFNLIYITADPKIRYQRYVKRNENIGDDKLDFAQFEAKDQAEAESQIPGVGQTAKYKIDNDGTIEQLYDQVESILKKLR
ncbi:MAG: hypothetical protein A3A24_01685 [Candidatus Buchananbacteria bacterium RIFCSPLOWO2_01_FULL_46_12]|uniref:Dephospho-CoA kinase n=2 Tax=Candidatus Buchananiibacteriota TaxID=1817903 RepID=A0A1G1YNU0_9BACT|nr:MAG: hypothetical protein A2744_02900 [Candidatus Buchananbacteria bacterium RIFCSPHIGHO2_01_FULL_44_11]OGY53476.1 MAG: hypothetical protein A3A24_01685 [Candidatus Buchananbacteria bacterium RIFCSPLOWO2_01_FULL_46_12]